MFEWMTIERNWIICKPVRNQNDKNIDFFWRIQQEVFDNNIRNRQEKIEAMNMKIYLRKSKIKMKQNRSVGTEKAENVNLKIRAEIR